MLAARNGPDSVLDRLGELDREYGQDADYWVHKGCFLAEVALDDVGGTGRVYDGDADRPTTIWPRPSTGHWLSTDLVGERKRMPRIATASPCSRRSFGDSRRRCLWDSAGYVAERRITAGDLVRWAVAWTAGRSRVDKPSRGDSYRCGTALAPPPLHQRPRDVW